MFVNPLELYKFLPKRILICKFPIPKNKTKGNFTSDCLFNEVGEIEKSFVRWNPVGETQRKHTQT